jgi:hypothetical protein
LTRRFPDFPLGGKTPDNFSDPFADTQIIKGLTNPRAESGPLKL